MKSITNILGLSFLTLGGIMLAAALVYFRSDTDLDKKRETRRDSTVAFEPPKQKDAEPPKLVNSTNPLLPPQTGVSECRLKYGHKFFPQEIVTKVLARRGFKPDLIAGVETQLATDETKIHDIVYEKSKSMNPNPFSNIDRRDDEKLYRDVVTTLFSQTLRTQGISKQKEINDTFDEIQLERATKFAACEGYSKYVKIKKGFMPVVRTLTLEEYRLDSPESFDPRLREQIAQQMGNK